MNITPHNLTKNENAAESVWSFVGMIGRWLSCFLGESCRSLEKLWVSPETAQHIASGKMRSPSLLPESQRSVMEPRILLNRSSRRVLRRRLPASRQYSCLRHLSGTALSGNGFLERAARFSANGRAVVYRLEFKRRLCQRRPQNSFARFIRPLGKTANLSMGLSFAFMWPD